MSKYSKTLAVGILALALLCNALYAQSKEKAAISKRPMEVEDVLRIKSIGSADISPDGSLVAFVVTWMDAEKNQNWSDIWLMKTEGGEPIKLTEDGMSELPKWSPDGRSLAFVAPKDGKSAIWVMDLRTKLRRFLTYMERSSMVIGDTGEELVWSPDGTMIAFVAAVGQPAYGPDDIRVYRTHKFLAWAGYADLRRRHVFVIPFTGYSPAKQLTFGDTDEHSIAWNPNSKEILFVSDRTGLDEWHFYRDLYAVSPETLEIRRITNSKAMEFQAEWSPDGTKIAYLSCKRDEAASDLFPEDPHIWIINADGSGAMDVTAKLDRRCSNPSGWSEDGKRVFFTAGDHGRTMVYAVVPTGGEVKPVTRGDRTIHSLSVAMKAGKMVYAANDEANPDELYVANVDGTKEMRLTHFHDQLVNEVYFSDAEEFWFPSFDGKMIQGWLLKPWGFDPSMKYPLLLYLHGGPHMMEGYLFRGNLGQPTSLPLLTSQGYVVAYVNERGSTGYGQAFSEANVRDMGGGDYKDYMKSVDYLLETRKYIDPERLGTWGHSYGGFMTNWIITHTDRFKAAVSMDPIVSMPHMYVTESPSWLDVELGNSTLWDDMELALEMSPFYHVGRHVKTPTLFLQGELDNPCPIFESELMFIILRRLRVPAELVIYPGEGHVVSKPKHLLDSHRRINLWFKTYLKRPHP